MNLMVVDDDSVVRMTLRTVLTSDGHSVVLAVDGVDALQKLEETKVDMIVADVYMPSMDGIRLRNTLREMPDKAHLPLLFISGYDDKATVEAVQDTKLEGFFKKGRPLTELLAWVKYLTTPIHKRPFVPPNASGQPLTHKQMYGRGSGNAKISAA
jgi:CheY-like chemotaxis protein